MIAIEEDSGTAADIIREIRESLYEEWIGDWRQGNSKLLKFGTEAGAVDSCHLPRKQQIAINRLRLGASMLSHVTWPHLQKIKSSKLRYMINPNHTQPCSC